MDNEPPFPFAELYGSAQAARGGPRVVPGIAISEWKTDARAMRCGLCLKKFSLLRWKHHCRVCGDVCCRRCLGFCLVDVPMLGVDLAYTCGRCIRRVATKPSAFSEDPDTGASSYLTIMSSPMSTSSLSSSCPSSPSGETLPPSPSSVSSSFNSPQTSGTSGAASSSLPASFSNALHSKKLTDSCGRAIAPFQVTVSQSRSAKLQSVCSLVGDYLDCAGAAVVLVSGNSDERDRHLWVVAHRGLRSRLLHDDAFLSLCQKATDRNTPFNLSEPKTRATASSNDTFRFAAVSPLRHRDIDVLEEQDDDETSSQDDSQLGDGEAVGCLVALDTRARSEASGQRVRKTLENLARLVMDLLIEEQTILRIFESGDFKMFASNALDLAPVTSNVFEAAGAGAISPPLNQAPAASSVRRKRSTPAAPTANFLSSMVMNRLRRSRSFGCVDCDAGQRPVLLEEDGFDIVAHPGMNVGRRHAATSNCRMGRRRPVSSRSPSTGSTSTAA